VAEVVDPHVAAEGDAVVSGEGGGGERTRGGVRRVQDREQWNCAQGIGGVGEEEVAEAVGEEEEAATHLGMFLSEH